MHFVEKAYFKDLEEDKAIYSIDINKCRNNILYYGDYVIMIIACSLFWIK
jgi:hypothetical protein